MVRNMKKSVFELFGEIIQDIYTSDRKLSKEEKQQIIEMLDLSDIMGDECDETE